MRAICHHRVSSLCCLTLGLIGLLAACSPPEANSERVGSSPRATDSLVNPAPCPPVGRVDLVRAEPIPAQIRLGPYKLTFPTSSYLDLAPNPITWPKGTGGVVNGKLNVHTTDGVELRLHALAPDMFGGQLPPRILLDARDKGLLYHVAITLMWSEDGHLFPGWSYRPEQPSPQARLVPGSLLVEDLPDQGGKHWRYFPVNTPDQYPIDCWRPYDGGRGQCSVLRKARGDLWMQYTFPSSRLACWHQLDSQVAGLLKGATSDWQRQ